MSRRHEDFDEFCDPENPRTIKYEDVVDAADRIRPYILKTPCFPSHHQKDFSIHIYYKCEFLQKSGSFKGRGASNTLQLLPLDKKKLGIVAASIGNEAWALCYHAFKLNIPTIIVMPNNVPLDKILKCHSLGAKVILQGSNLMESQRYARAIARDKGLTYINGRDHPHMLAGFGTVGLEILEQVPFVDAVIVPVGGGGLISAIARVIKHVKPTCLVYGVQVDNMPVFFKSLEIDDLLTVPMQSTMADAIAVTNAGVNGFHNARPLVDEMWQLLVNEDWVARSILHLMEMERFVVEGAGACPLAAIIGNLVPELKLKNVVCVLSGGNIDNLLLSRCLERGRAAEGRLVRFKVGTKDNTPAIAHLCKLLVNGGFNIIQHFHEHIWIDNEVYNVEIRVVCETRGLDHALELKRIIERNYPCTSVFETEPLNDKRTCPCYVRKIV
ncbi:L-threonine ammonia-lyase isoform X2 [Manduca sexta]|uniref:L-threonine ammonia-lyase isoform X2 n=1 Tax=Manduca sexta TaxID=7130 RepID=UPI00188F2527|nr:L-threonine ammonia-lyase isoform X2 [Manduca sexta]